MAETLTITVDISSDYKSIVVTDETDWTSLGDTIDSLTSITLNFYTTTLLSTAYTYEFNTNELDEYVALGTITLDFLDLFSREYALDNWYDVQMVANDGDYVSVYDGFGSDAYITPKVFENVNNLYTPEPYKKTIEPIAMQVIFLEGMKWLGVSSLTDRKIKWAQRLNILTRYNP